MEKPEAPDLILNQTNWTARLGLRGYLDCLPEDQRAGFMGQALERLQKHYPAQSDGRVLFIFQRLIFIAYKTWEVNLPGCRVEMILANGRGRGEAKGGNKGGGSPRYH